MQSSAAPPLDDLRLAVQILLYSILDRPELVILSLEASKQGTLFRIDTPHGSDRGKLIGKQGRNIHSLRVLLLAAGRKYGQQFTVDISASPEERANVPQAAHLSE